MELNEFDGPYFLGQESALCGHYYPDVLLAVDSLDRAGKINRITFCFKCNKHYDEEILRDRLDKPLLKELAEKGKKIYATIEELAKFREEKLKSVLPGSDW